jgi:hypothetical protein
MKTIPKAKTIELEQDCIVCDGKYYNFEDIVSISYYYLVTRHSFNLVPTGSEHTLSAIVHFRNADPILVQPRLYAASLSFPSVKRRIKEQVAETQDKIFTLMRATFAQRARSYTNMMEGSGYFVYDNKRFYRNGTIEFGEAGTRVFHIGGNDKLYKRDFEVFSERDSFFSKIADKLSRSQLRISTMTDPDVFFFLMERYFGLRWR